MLNCRKHNVLAASLALLLAAPSDSLLLLCDLSLAMFLPLLPHASRAHTLSA